MGRRWAVALRAGRFPRPDRNPLRRGIDRVEALIILITLAGMAMGAPVSAVAVGRLVFAAGERLAHAQPAGPLIAGSLAITAGLLAPMLLGLVLGLACQAVHWLLDRQRLAGWERAWSAVGPEWTGRR
jgi:hypothetical protein